MTTHHTQIRPLTPNQALKRLNDLSEIVSYELAPCMGLSFDDFRQYQKIHRRFKRESWLYADGDSRQLLHVYAAAECFAYLVNTILNDNETTKGNLDLLTGLTLTVVCDELTSCAIGLKAWAEATSQPDILAQYMALFATDWAHLSRQLKARNS